MLKRLFGYSVVTLLFVLTLGCQAQETANNQTEKIEKKLKLVKIGDYNPEDAGSYAAEIVCYDEDSNRLCISDGSRAAVRIVDISQPSKPELVKLVTFDGYGESNSVAAHGGLFAVALNNADPQKPGHVFFISTSGEVINSVEAGAMPDMVTFTPDGKKVLVANEGEPNDDYSIDPVGSVTIIDLSVGVANVTVENCITVGFDSVDTASLPQYVRIIKPGATAAEDFEPEYIAVSADSRTAYVSLQENNAIATVDVSNGTLTAVNGLPWKDYSKEENAIDASDKDDAVRIKTWPVFGMPQPDTIATFEIDGNSYLVTANEGDAKDYAGFSEEVRVADLELDPEAFPNATELQKKENLGRLKTTTVFGNGKMPEDGIYERIFSYGNRSFSIFRIDEEGLERVYDSGSFFERHFAEVLTKQYNSDNDVNDSLDDRSDDKGPEPEALALGSFGDSIIAFIGMERAGGIFAFRIDNPEEPVFEDFVITRNFNVAADSDTPGHHTGPEGMCFINKQTSPTGEALLVVSYEVTGSIAIFQLEESKLNKE
jgi:hypothetical protein